MNLRTRLTMLNGLVLLLTILAFAGAVLLTQRQVLEREINDSLADQAREYSEATLISLDRASRRFTILPPDPNVFAASAYFIQVVGQDGEVAGRTKNLGDFMLPNDERMLADALDGREWYTDYTVDDQPLRLFIAPLRVKLPSGDTINAGMIQVGRSLDPTYATLRALQSTFAVVGLAVVALSLLVGWLLARAALAPIDRLAATAHAIGAAQDFAQRMRLPKRQRRDEVGRLAEEFNGMLARLQSAYEQVEASLAAQRRFVADASHELRTPITSVRGNVDLLRRLAANGTATAPPEQQELLEDLASEARRMAHLVADLLLLAQADAGQHLARGPVAVGPIAQDAFRAARFLKVGVELALGETSEAAWVDGDSSRLKQLLLILLDNALKYTPVGGQVRLDVEQQDSQVLLRVADTGPGIPPEALPHVFERFFRSDAARGDGGAGLGLAIAQWIVAEHHGQIQVASQPGQGSTFTVTLTAIPPPDAASPHQRAEPVPARVLLPAPT